MSTSDKPRLSAPPIASIVAAALLSAGFTWLCGISHSALASAFGGFVIVALALPSLAAASDREVHAVFVIPSSSFASILIWLSLPISWTQWGACAAALLAFALALAGVTRAISRAGVSPIVSASIVLVISLAWLSWPIWLSPWLAGHQSLVDALVFAHPLLAVNGTLIDQGIWTERPRMYGWTALNQDISFSMPQSVLWCVILHGAIGSAGISTAVWKKRSF